MAAPATEAKRFRPDIEGLRGLAVCLVVAYHSAPRRFHGGFIGVDVFFVISGYLITGLLVREIEETRRLSFTGFYARRVRRLLPASAVVFLATLVACGLFLSPLQQARLGDSARYTALYISNFWFLRQASDYFGSTIGNNPFLHTWSLAVEEQFYLVWPALILAGLRGRTPRRNLLTTMILVAAASLAVSVWSGGVLASWAFFNPGPRVWEFAIGGITFLSASQELRSLGKMRAVVSWLGLAAVLAAGVLIQGQTGWPGWLALIPVAGTAAILGCRVPKAGASRVLELRISQWVGRNSYSWYLWHWPVLTLARIVSPGLTSSQLWLEVILCAAGSLGLAVATHTLVENPIRFSRLLVPRRVLSVAGAALVTVVTVGAAMLWQHTASQASQTLERGLLAGVVRDPEGPEGTCPNVGLLNEEVRECMGGDPAAAVTIVLFGDSHAGQWFPAFDALAADRGWRLDLIRKSGCPSAWLTVYSPVLNRTYAECDVWREAAMRRIIELSPAAVVIANRQLQNFSAGLRGADDTWRGGSRKTFEKLESAGLSTIVLRDTPSPGVDIPDCLTGDTSWWARKRAPRANPCALDRAKALDEGVFRAEQEAAAGLSHVKVVDLSDLFCEGAVCPAVLNGMIVYRDDNHLTEPFARSLAPALEGRLGPLISAER